MTDLPSVSAARLIRALQCAGFFTVVKRGILRSILRQAGLTADDLGRLM
jgi:predicted RNA binding protein YcfA (HicA-like mRNA interferase family)